MTAPAPSAPWPFRRTLVTGGAGFIGSALVWALNGRGVDRVVVCDQLGTSGKWRNLAPLAFEDYLEADDLLPRLAAGRPHPYGSEAGLRAAFWRTLVADRDQAWEGPPPAAFGRGLAHFLAGDGGGDGAEIMAYLVPAAARLARRQVGAGDSLPPSHDPSVRALRRVLSCAALAARRDGGAGGLLDSRCNRR